MAAGVWEPGGGGSPQARDRALLDALAAAGEGQEAMTEERLRAQGLTGHQWLMRCEASAWTQAAAELGSAELLALVRFFTLVEAGVAGWEAGKTSPVIPLVKLLRDRGDFTPETRKWIKAHTDNRYLPYGSAL